MAYAMQALLGLGQPDLIASQSDASTPSSTINWVESRIGREPQEASGGAGGSYDWGRLGHALGAHAGQPQGAYLVCLNDVADIWHTSARAEATYDQDQCFVLSDFAGPRGVTAADAWSELAGEAGEYDAIVIETPPGLGAPYAFGPWLEKTGAETIDELGDLFVFTYTRHGQAVGEEAGSARQLAEHMVHMHFDQVSAALTQASPSRDDATAEYIASEGLEAEVYAALARLANVLPGACPEVELLPSVEHAEGPILAFKIASQHLDRKEFRQVARGFHEWLRDSGYTKLYELAGVVRA